MQKRDYPGRARWQLGLDIDSYLRKGMHPRALSRAPEFGLNGNREIAVSIIDGTLLRSWGKP